MDENGNKFEVISSKTSKANFNHSSGFGKTIILPFFSGVVGCALVIGTCFGVPSIKEKLTGDTKLNSTVQTSTPTGTTSNLVSIANSSGTAEFAANKILPSIVGIEVSYTATSNSIFSFGTPSSQTATATGSGIIISEDGYILKKPT